MKLKTTTLLLTLTTGLLPLAANAGFSLPSGSASPGHGISNVLSGSIANGALYWQSTTNWLTVTRRTLTPSPMTFAPACDQLGGANCHNRLGRHGQLHQPDDGHDQRHKPPLANPLTFGTTGHESGLQRNGANTYGSGSGLWLVTLPVPPEMF